jgi:MYXO-CTERM domain-containing protein
VLALVAACTAPVDDAEEPASAPPHEPLVRPDTPGNNLQFNFERSDLVEAFTSPGGRFVIHYTRMGPNAVPAADDDVSGVPDFVEEVAGVYDEVIDFYESDLGFRSPLGDGAISDNGGSGLFDVYLVDFAGVGDGAFQQDGCTTTNPDQCIGYMVQENDYVGYGYPSTLVANRILGSHELFHAIQAAYDVGQGTVLSEGTAVWATERFDPSLGDFEAFIDGYLDNTDRPIDEPFGGPVDPFSYGSAIVFQFFEEAYGPGVIRALWEATENGAGGVADPAWVDALDPVLQSVAGLTFADAFTEMAKWNLYTDDFADPAVAYDAGAGYVRVRIDDVAFPLQEDELRVYRASAQYRGGAPGGRGAMTAALVPTEAAPDAAADLRVLVAVESGDSVTVTRLDDATAGTQTVPTASADRFVVVVVNTLVAGDSKKPGLCVGTAEEVDACKQSLTSGGEGGAGGAGAGGGGDPDGDAEDDGEGCTCSVTLSDTPGSNALGAVLLLGLAAQRLARRRRRANIATSAAR